MSAIVDIADGNEVPVLRLDRELATMHIASHMCDCTVWLTREVMAAIEDRRGEIIARLDAIEAAKSTATNSPARPPA